MSLTLATLIPAIFLAVVGALLLVNNSAIAATFKAFPRSKTAAGILFSAGALWFLYNVWHLSEADFGEYRKGLFIGFAAVAALAFYYVPDFLAVRGAAILMLLVATPLLDSGFLDFHSPQICLYKIAIFVGVALAIYLGAVPYRLRDFFQWLFATGGRPRALGGALLAYGLLLCVVAFTY
ncbi:MAG TPA: hypothetical protein VIM69_03755 [Opitutaceae bacterium]